MTPRDFAAALVAHPACADDALGALGHGGRENSRSLPMALEVLEAVGDDLEILSAALAKFDEDTSHMCRSLDRLRRRISVVSAIERAKEKGPTDAA